jgi:hypothetical protein
MKDIKLKDECFECGVFDQTMPLRYICAVKSCPGLNWSMNKKERIIKEVAWELTYKPSS